MSILKWLFGVAVRAKLRFFLALVMGACTSGFYVLFLKLFQSQLGDIQSLDLTSLGLTVLLCLAFVACSLGGELAIISVTEDTKRLLRLKIVQSIMGTALIKVEEYSGNRLLTVLTTDVENVGMGLLHLPRFINSLFMLAGCLFAIALSNFRFFFILLALFTFMFFIISFFQKKGKKAQKVYRKKQDGLFRLFYTTVFGIKEFQLHHRRRYHFYYNILKPYAEKIKKIFISGRFYYICMEKGTLVFLVSSVALSLATIKIMGMPEIYEELTKTFLLLGGIFPPLLTLQKSVLHLDRIKVSLDNIEECLHEFDSEEIPEKLPGPRFYKPGSSLEVEFSGIKYTFHDDRQDDFFQLGPFNYKFSQPEIVFLTGGNGTGKTTLAKIICGLYTPEHGRITCGDQVITSENIRQYRQLFSAIFDDYFLFKDFWGIDKQEYSRRATDYLELFELDHKVSIQDNRYSSINLSKGQKKRLAMIIALLEDRPFYIFDEWAADQDPGFRKKFYEDILPDFKRRNKIVLMITHDDRYFHLADRRIKLDAGEARYIKKEIDEGSI